MLNKLQIYRLGRSPLQHSPTRELGAIVKPDCLRESAVVGDRLEGADDVMTPKREGYIDCQAFSGVVVNHVHCSNRSTGREPIVHEVDRPTLVRSSHRSDRVPTHVLYFSFFLGWTCS